jgi:hypothetical protein
MVALLVRQRLVQVCGQIGNQRPVAGTSHGSRKARLGGAAMGSPAPGLGDDFACESEGGTEIERKVGG